MKAVFFQEMKQTRKGLFLWSGILALVASMGMMEYPVLAPHAQALQGTLSMIPKIWQLMFGVYRVDLGDPLGYHYVMYYWAGLLAFCHAAYLGVSLVAKETRDRTAEYLFTKPIARSRILWAKMLAGLLNLLVMATVCTLFFLLSMLFITREAAVYRQIALSGVGMFLTQCMLMALGLLCSGLFGSYRRAVAGITGLVLLSYGLMFFVQYTESTQWNFLSPLTFFGVAEVTTRGFSPHYLLLGFGLLGLCAWGVQWLYREKAVV